MPLTVLPACARILFTPRMVGNKRPRKCAFHNVYADEDSETHFRDIEIELSEAGPDETRQSDFLRPGSYFRPLHGMFFI